MIVLAVKEGRGGERRRGDGMGGGEMGGGAERRGQGGCAINGQVFHCLWW